MLPVLCFAGLLEYVVCHVLFESIIGILFTIVTFPGYIHSCVTKRLHFYCAQEEILAFAF